MLDKDVFGISSDNVNIDDGLPFVDTKAHAEHARQILSMSEEERKEHMKVVEAKMQALWDNVELPSDTSLLRVTCRGHNRKS